MPRLEYIRIDHPYREAMAAATAPVTPSGDDVITRFTFETTDLQGFDVAFEQMMWFYGRAVVVVSRVRPRVADIEPAFPFRILTTEPSTRDFIRGMNRRMIEIAAVVPESAPLAGMERFLRDHRWATAEILHITEPLPADPLRTSRHAPPGTAGWLLRIADLWQTRLIVIEYDGMASPALRRLGATIVDHGGPAVMLIPRGVIQDLYWGFVHDRPLDWIASRTKGYLLFAGEGREELLRYSRIPAGLASRSFAEEMAPVLASRSARAPKKNLFAKLAKASDAMETQLRNTTFEFSEGQGLVPSKEMVDSMFVPLLNEAGRDEETEVVRGALQLERSAPRTEPEQRHVNAAFFGKDERGEPQQLDQSHSLTCVPVLFGIQIGPRDEIVKTVGSTALIEEKFRWMEEKNGVTIQIAVTGIDFDVHGANVQDVWLPRTGTTDRIFFTVVPRNFTTIPGVARMRYSIYFENNVVQSYMAAAVIGTPDHGPRELLTKVFGLSASQIPLGVAWTTMIEYAGAPLHAVAQLPPRGLSIIANESAGEKVYTVKGEELFSVSISTAVSSLIKDLRDKLRELSAVPDAPSKYRYRFKKTDNLGDPAQLDDALFSIANLGWQLYSKIVNDSDDRKRVDDILGSHEETVQVADVKLGDIVPWSLIYDREFDPLRKKRRDATGNMVDAKREVCHAAWPDVDGNLPVTACKGPQCVLSQGRPELGEDTVVCPLRFWGYKHQIEVPVQQTTNKAEANATVPTPVARTRPVKISAAMNRKLPLYKEHEDRLTSFLAKNAAVAAIDGQIIDDRDTLKDTLRDAQPDIVYLYCHAFPRTTLPNGDPFGPNLGFGGESDDALISADNLTGDVWTRAPLVFLNGCSTVGFDPYAPSPFATQFVKTRHAGALIGTEVTVWEILAAEMAETFFAAFLKNASAGDALRRARRLLLLKNNPLGLVYTLYGKADVAL